MKPKIRKEFKKHRYFRELCDYLAVNPVDREIITFLTRITHSHAGQIKDNIGVDVSKRWIHNRLFVLLYEGTITDVTGEVSSPIRKRRYYALTDNFKKVMCSFSGTNRW